MAVDGLDAEFKRVGLTSDGSGGRFPRTNDTQHVELDEMITHPTLSQAVGVNVI